MIRISGTYQLAGCSKTYSASLVLSETGQAVICDESGQRLADVGPDDYIYGDVIPGLAVDLKLTDGALFIPDDSQFRWPGLTNNHRLPEWLESHWLTAFTSVLMVPLFLWTMVNYVLPAAAYASVAYFPDSIAASMGEQTLYILDKTQLDESELSLEQQQTVTQLWQQIIHQLDLPEHKFRLHFRQSNLGANAMALPGGSIIVTDDIVTLMADNPDALLAILLHEVGHIKHQHSLKRVAQTTATTMLFALMFGEFEGAGELILGVGTGLLQSSFSRDMEREADEFSHQNLPKFGITPTAFADAMVLLLAAHTHEKESDSPEKKNMKDTLSHWLNYLSSHPETQERINSARNAKGNISVL